MTDLSPVQANLLDYAGRVTSFADLGVSIKKGLGIGMKGRLMTVMTEGAVEIRNEIVLSMRNSPATGKLYLRGYRQTKKGGQRPVFHRASQPGFAPRPDSGDLIRSIIMDARMTEVEVGSVITDPPYPRWLEEGTQKMEARPWLWPAQTKVMPKLKVNLRRVLNSAGQEMRE